MRVASAYTLPFSALDCAWALRGDTFYILMNRNLVPFDRIGRTASFATQIYGFWPFGDVRKKVIGVF